MNDELEKKCFDVARDIEGFVSGVLSHGEIARSLVEAIRAGWADRDMPDPAFVAGYNQGWAAAMKCSGTKLVSVSEPAAKPHATPPSPDAVQAAAETLLDWITSNEKGVADQRQLEALADGLTPDMPLEGLREAVAVAVCSAEAFERGLRALADWKG
jgi:hypothetical protein